VRLGLLHLPLCSPDLSYQTSVREAKAPLRRAEARTFEALIRGVE